MLHFRSETQNIILAAKSLLWSFLPSGKAFRNHRQVISLVENRSSGLQHYSSRIGLEYAARQFHQSNANFITPSIQQAQQGKLSPNFQFLEEMKRLSVSQKPFFGQPGHKVVVLGYNSRSLPLLQYMNRDTSVHVVVGSSDKDEEATDEEKLDVSGNDILGNLLKEADLLICLKHSSHCPSVAKLCIENKVDMITAAYMSPQLKKLHCQALDAGITVLGEVGLRPGLDHLLAAESLEKIKKEGGMVTSFVSLFGHLPAPEFSENPLRFKFRGDSRPVLNAFNSRARYLENGGFIEIPPGYLLYDRRDADCFPALNLHFFPEGDSNVYVDAYGIKNARNVLRGTLWYKGFSDVITSLEAVGLLEDTKHPLLNPNGQEVTWKQLVWTNLNQEDQDLPHSSFRHLIFNAVGKSRSHVRTLEQLGVLADDPVEKHTTPLRTLSRHLQLNFAYGEGERDMVILRNDIEVSFPDGVRQTRHVDFVVYGGEDGSTAERTAGTVLGLAARLMLSKKIKSKGILLPVVQEVYKPLLKALRDDEGFKTREHLSRL